MWEKVKLRIALEEQDDATVSAARAGNEKAFSSMEERPIAPGNPPAIAMILSFFPTVEGFYDYENLRYIYQQGSLGKCAGELCKREKFLENCACE